jgi:thiamine biosynthesis lipoprotein
MLRPLRSILPMALLLLASLAPPPVAAEWLSREEAIMGTAIRVELWAEDKAAGAAAIDAVMDEMRRIDVLMSPYKPDSELSRVNRDAAAKPVRIGRELYDLIALSLDYSKKTGGAFDITFSSVGYLYDYRRGIRPSEADIAANLDAIDYRHLELDPKTRSIRFARPGVRIDLGGIAKGYAVDAGIAILKKCGFQHALVSAGGDSRILGDHRGRPWVIGIRNPRGDDQSMVAALPLTNEAISTSGDYERYFEADGVRYHHIINPRTGKSAGALMSTTVIGPDATTTDALSTSVFVLGPKAGMALIESLPGIEAVIVMPDGRMEYSAGLKRP